jgi:hypothetical protein
MISLSSLFAAAMIGTWTVGDVAIAVIVILAIIAVVLIVCRAFGVTIPQWVWAILGVCLAAFLGVLAVKFLMSL